MSRKDKVPRFLYDWRAAIVAFPAIAFYCGFIPLLKLCGVVKMSWLWALSPIWIPFAAFWIVVGFVAFLALVAEVGFLILPDENVIFEKKD